MTTLTFICLSVITIAVVTFLYAWIDNYQVRRKAQENEYDMRYLWISDRIEKEAHNLENYKNIERQLKCLGQLPWKNGEKTNILSIHFKMKWITEWELARREKYDIITENEFSPEEVLRRN